MQCGRTIDTQYHSLHVVMIWTYLVFIELIMFRSSLVLSLDQEKIILTGPLGRTV